MLGGVNEASTKCDDTMYIYHTLLISLQSRSVIVSSGAKTPAKLCMNGSSAILYLVLRIPKHTLRLNPSTVNIPSRCVAELERPPAP